ncbi:MAG: acyclic terpene utilization AtuA family protein [Solirubrobacterales bacterium]|nr:acyclic terpene utilization AtuA family protein [Solirubrobacterales bacterium]
MTVAADATVVGAGAGFAGDRIEPAVALASSGALDAVVLECLAERTLAQALAGDPGAPRYDRRLRRRLAPLLPVAHEHGCTVISNLGAADPAGAAHEVATLASELGLGGLRVAAVLGDDLTASAPGVDWLDELPDDADLRAVHCYLGLDGPARAIEEGADVVITGRVADAALFAAPARGRLGGGEDALAGALAIGHLLECGPQLCGGNFAAPGGEGPSAAELARIGYPIARIEPDGGARSPSPPAPAGGSMS